VQPVGYVTEVEVPVQFLFRYVTTTAPLEEHEVAMLPSLQVLRGYVVVRDGVPLQVVEPANSLYVAEVAACAVPARAHNRRAKTTLEFMMVSSQEYIKNEKRNGIRETSSA
jgi:hypothetical protein